MSKILIAFSGGPDSVYLYHYLKKRKHEIYLCYVNHNVRDDVENDIKFVREFGKNNNVPFVIKSINLDKFNENNARELRYAELENARKEFDCEYIATGHNKNDNVETLIFRLTRGTGLDGLKGIPRQRGLVIRPILDVSKEYILKYLDENDIGYLIDYTNNQDIYTRNIIRNKIIPILKEINPNVINNISNLIELVNISDDENEKIIKELKKYDINISKNKIDEILSVKNKVGSSIRLNDKYIWYVGYNKSGVKELIEEINYSYTLEKGKTINIFNYEISINSGAMFKNSLEKSKFKIYNIDKIEKIIIRNRKYGDRINSKKIKDILISNKIDKDIRNQIPVITDEAGNVLLLADIKSLKGIVEIKNICELDDNKTYVSIIRKEHKC